MTASDVVDKALELLEGGWCQGSYARTESGDKGLATDSDAIAYCAEGALFKAVTDANCPDLLGEARQLVIAQTGCYSIPSWNDHPHRSFAQVREIFRRASFSGQGAATRETNLVVAGAA